MNILNRLTVKHLKMNKRRTIVSIIGIILSTALMVGIGLICSSVREFIIDETISSSGNYHAQISSVDVTKLENIENNKNIKEYRYEYGFGYARYEESDNKYKPYFYIDAVNDAFFDELNIIEGRAPKSSDEIVISNHIFSQGHGKYKVGDTISLEYGTRILDNYTLNNSNPYYEEEEFVALGNKTYKIVGICERSGYENYSSPGFYIFTKASNNYTGKVDLYLLYENPSDAYKISKAIYKNLGKEVQDGVYEISYNNSLLSLYGVSNYDNINSFISGFLTIFLSIISVACIIVIYNSFAISVMERKKQFGLFSSIGATKEQIRKTVFYEAFLVGSIGIVIGILGAYIGIGTVVMILNKLLVKTLNGISLKLVTYPMFIIIPVIFIILVIIISAFIPARRASKISPIEVIRQNDDIKINKRKIRTSKLVDKIFGIEGTIALKNIKRNKKKYRITIASLFISIVTFIAFSSYLKFGKLTADSYMLNIDYDIEVTVRKNNKDLSLNSIEQLITHEDVEDYLQYELLYVSTKIIDKEYLTKEYLDFYGDPLPNNIGGDSRMFDYFNVIKLDDNSYNDFKKSIGLTDDKIILLNKFYTIDYENNNRKVIGLNHFKDNVKISLCDEELKQKIESSEEYISGGMYPSDVSEEEYSNMCSYTLDNLYFVNDDSHLKLFNDVLHNDFTIIVNSDNFDKIKEVTKSYNYDYNYIYGIRIKASKFDELNKIGKKINSYGYYSNITEDNNSNKNAILAIEILLYGFISLVTLIGLTSVFNTINTSINLRKREFSILRSIGLTPKGFNKMICFESIFFGLKSLIYGIPVGLFLSILIASNMNNLVNFKYSIPIGSVIISIVGVFVVVLITMWYSTRKIKKENILESIREENI